MVRRPYHRPQHLVPEVRGNLPVGRICRRPGLSTRRRPCAAEYGRRVFGTRLQARARPRSTFLNSRAISSRSRPGHAGSTRPRCRFTASATPRVRTRVSITGSNHWKPARWSRSSRCRGIGSGRGIRCATSRIGPASAPAPRSRRSRRRRRCCFRRRDSHRRRHLPPSTGASLPATRRRGGLYSIAWYDFKDADDVFNFQRIDAEIQQSYRY